jgi:hypothetical protein
MAGGQTPILWVDGVGGYLLWTLPRILLGRTGSQSCDCQILGDLGDRSYQIWRTGEKHLGFDLPEMVGAEPKRLRHGDRIILGESVRLEYQLSNPWSATALLKILPPHRWREAIDGVLMVDRCIVLGASSQCHLRCLEWKDQVVIWREAEAWHVKSSVPLECQGKEVGLLAPLEPGKRLLGPDFSLSLQVA